MCTLWSKLIRYIIQNFIITCYINVFTETFSRAKTIKKHTVGSRIKCHSEKNNHVSMPTCTLTKKRPDCAGNLA